MSEQEATASTAEAGESAERERSIAEAAERALAEAEARRKAEAAPVEGAPAEERPAELNGPKGPEPTRFGDWEKKGIASDF